MKCERCDKDTDDTKRYAGRTLCNECYLEVKNWKKKRSRIRKNIQLNKNEKKGI